MKAIVTKFHGATDYHGRRISATAEGCPRIYVPYPSDQNDGEEAHRVAAEALQKKLGWTGKLIGGSLPGSGYAFVFAGGK